MYGQLHPDKAAAVQKILGKKKRKPKQQGGQMIAKLAQRVYSERVNG